jgi:hypothetical protein
MGTGLSRGKAAGAWRWPPTPSSAEVKERVELYFYSPSGPSWPVLGWTLHLTLSIMYFLITHTENVILVLFTSYIYPTSLIKRQWIRTKSSIFRNRIGPNPLDKNIFNTISIRQHFQPKEWRRMLLVRTQCLINTLLYFNKIRWASSTM